MNPWVNIILLIPALLIVSTIILIRIKGRLENKLFLYRHEGIVLQTSLVFFKMRMQHSRWERSLGLALLTGERLIVFNWNQKPVFECEFQSADERMCDLEITKDKKNVIVCCECGTYPKEIALTVRNPDAWKLEFSRLRSHESSSE
jgi:hypothetical protein